MSEKTADSTVTTKNNLYFEPKYPTSSGADCLSLSNHHLLFGKEAHGCRRRKRKACHKDSRSDICSCCWPRASTHKTVNTNSALSMLRTDFRTGQIRNLTMTEEGCIAIKTGFILNIYNGATFDRFPYDKTRKYIWAYDRPPKVLRPRRTDVAQSWATCFCST